MGNRISASDGVITTTYTYNDNHELLTAGATTYQYDANGNTVAVQSASGPITYTYGCDNRLEKVENSLGIVAQYHYDPFGRRLWKDADGQRTYYYYADEGLVAEFGASAVDPVCDPVDDCPHVLNPAQAVSYGYRPDSMWSGHPVFQIRNGHYYYYQNDSLGAPVRLMDAAGLIVWSADYEVFGLAQVNVDDIPNNLRFPGQYYDAETGLHYNWHRYYDTSTGRYLTPDPIGLAGGINLYAYVGANPVNYVDPMGLIAPAVIWGALKLVDTALTAYEAYKLFQAISVMLEDECLSDAEKASKIAQMMGDKIAPLLLEAALGKVAKYAGIAGKWAVKGAKAGIDKAGSAVYGGLAKGWNAGKGAVK